MEWFFLITYCLGLVAIMYVIILGWIKYKEKHQVSETVENILGIVLLAIFGLGGIVMINSYKQSIETYHEKSQLSICLESRNSDGEYFTEEQCWFFRDVLGGKYLDNDNIEDDSAYNNEY